MKKIYLTILSVIFIFPLRAYGTGQNLEELSQRAEESIRSSYALINQNWRYPKNNKTRFSPPKNTAWKEFLSKTTSGTMSMLFWDGAMGINLLKSVNTLLNTEGLEMDCSNAARIVRLKLLCDLLGGKKAEQWALRINLTSNSAYSFMHRLGWSFFDEKAYDDDVSTGTAFFSFLNVKQYGELKPDGFAISHNVARFTDGTFLGFDPDFFAEEPRTYEEVEMELYNDFINPKRVKKEDLESHKQYCKRLTPENFKGMRRNYQGKSKIAVLNLEKVSNFIETGKFL